MNSINFKSKPSESSKRVALSSRQPRDCYASGEFRADLRSGNLTDRKLSPRKSSVEFNPEKKYQVFKEKKFKQGLQYASQGSLKKLIMNSSNAKEVKAVLSHSRKLARVHEPKVQLNLESSRERSPQESHRVKKSRNGRRIGTRTFH